MTPEEIRRQVEIGNFFATNGRVLRTANVMELEYKRISSIAYVLSDIDNAELAKSIAYLADSGYLALRRATSKTACSLSDAPLSDLECRLTPKGTQLLCGVLHDGCVEV